jgi:integrase
MRKYPSAKDLAKLTKRGRYAVGNNVYLQISEWGTRSWLLRYRTDGRATHMGLGPYDLLTLAEARECGHQARRQLLHGVDPLKAKRAAKRQRALDLVHSKTFKECALAYITAHEAGWRGDHSRHQWSASLEKYVYPKIGNLSVADVDLACVLSVVEPIWTVVPETARRVRNRIELILDWATARGLRQGDNPARWRGLLENLLSEQRRAQAVNHLAAVPYQDIGAFMEKLRSQEGIPAKALEFLILTASRSSEALGAKWSEIDGATRTVPAARMKAHKEHRVPLSRRAVELLASLPHDSDFVFPAVRVGGASRDYRNADKKQLRGRCSNNRAEEGLLQDRQDKLIKGFSVEGEPRRVRDCTRSRLAHELGHVLINAQIAVPLLRTKPLGCPKNEVSAFG